MKPSTHHTALAVALASTLLSCARRPARAAQESAAFGRAQSAATELVQRLRGELQNAIRAGGPVSAIAVCSERAPELARTVGAQHRVRVGRASTQLRNPANAPPDWVSRWLDAHPSGRAEGLSGVREVSGGTVRFLRPIAVEPACVTCHGDPMAMAPALRDALSARYPTDRATGYAPGDLRGALWAEATIE